MHDCVLHQRLKDHGGNNRAVRFRSDLETNPQPVLQPQLLDSQVVPNCFKLIFQANLIHIAFQSSTQERA